MNRLLAALVLALAVAAGAAGAGAARPSAVPGTNEVASLLRGIPQQGALLGRQSAPLTLVEYADIQCPYCRQFARQTLPAIVRTYVKTGRVRILFRGVAILGMDSLKGLRWTFAAGRQNKLWNMFDLLLLNQGVERSGWVTTAKLTAVARSVPGLDLARLKRDAVGAPVAKQIARARAAATAARLPGVPYLEAGPSLAELEPLALTSFDPAELAARLDALLAD